MRVPASPRRAALRSARYPCRSAASAESRGCPCAGRVEGGSDGSPVRVKIQSRVVRRVGISAESCRPAHPGNPAGGADASPPEDRRARSPQDGRNRGEPLPRADRLEAHRSGSPKPLAQSSRSGEDADGQVRRSSREFTAGRRLPSAERRCELSDPSTRRGCRGIPN